MIQPGTRLIVQDNSGGRVVKCIRVLNKKGRGVGGSGDFLVVSIQSLRKKGRIKVKKKEVCLALVITLRSPFSRKNGIVLKTSKNSCILLNRQFKSYGTRVFGTVLKEFRKDNKFKLLSLSSNFI
jgi:large subunit ribosomal protein L14